MPVTRKIEPESEASPSPVTPPREYNRNRYDIQVRVVDLDSKQTIYSTSALFASVADVHSSSSRLHMAIRSLCMGAVYQLQAILMGKPTLPPGINLMDHDQARANQLAGLLQAGKVTPEYSTVLPGSAANPREYIMVTRLRKN